MNSTNSNSSALVAYAILTFWFDDPSVKASEYGQKRRVWFRKDPTFDQHVRQRFYTSYEQARLGTYDDWVHSPKTALALTVMLDQFPRNMFRGTPRSFEAGEQALAVAQEAIAQKHDQVLIPVERQFLYLPFEHSENLEHQNQSVALFEALVREAPELNDSLQYAYRHRIIIDRFGCFPHRNNILNRPSTPAEIEFLKQPGSGF